MSGATGKNGSSTAQQQAPPPAAGSSNVPAGAGNTFDNFNGSTGATGTVGTPTSGSGSQIAPPAAAFSPYEYQLVQGAHVVLGPQIASLLGLSPTTSWTGAQIMQAFVDAPYANLLALQHDLYAAGMYVNAAGEQPNVGIVQGQMDNNSFEAMSQAILAINNNTTGETLSSYLAQQQLSGAGQARISKALQPITGGGNAYQVNLTSPTDIYATAMQIFQQYLGRNPTQAELQQIVGTVQSGESHFQQAQIAQTEGQQQAKYQQQVASRNAQMTPFQAAPPGQSTPNGPFKSPGQYAVSLLQYLGFPVNSNSVATIIAWIAKNGGLNGPGRNNPLGVSATAQGGSPSSGSQNFATPAEGLQAAANLLGSASYQALYGALASGKTADLNSPQVKSELGQWSGGKITSLNTAAQQAAAQAAVAEYNTQATQQTVAQGTPGTVGALGPRAGQYPGGGPDQNTAPAPAQTTPELTRQQAPGFMGPLPNAPGQPVSTDPSVPPSTVGQGQGPTAPGDQYLPASTLTATQAPSPTAVATTAATTGANAVPYLGQQFLDAYQSILQLIQSPLR